MMTAAPYISVIICTYNRDNVFSETLSSFAKMDFSLAGDFELIIIDNNSNDGTAGVANEFCAGHSYARYLFEPQPGLSIARNRGIRESRGEIVVFIDDDVFLDSKWLGEVARAFREHPDAAAFGGKSIPHFETSRPAWVRDSMLGIYGDTQLGDDPRWIDYPNVPFGLNMGFRRHLFDDIGYFNPKLGRIKGSLLSSEEVELFWRISVAGLKVLYVPHALLFHRIPASRVDPNWVIRRYYWQGVSEVVFNQGIHPKSRLKLLTEGVRDLWEAFRAMSGNHLSPRRMLWHYHGVPMADKVDYWMKLGAGWQKLKLTTSFHQ